MILMAMREWDIAEKLPATELTYWLNESYLTYAQGYFVGAGAMRT